MIYDTHNHSSANLLDSIIACMFSLRVSIVAMPMLMSPVSVASNTHCSMGLEPPGRVQAASTAGSALFSTSDKNAGSQLES